MAGRRMGASIRNAEHERCDAMMMLAYILRVGSPRGALLLHRPWHRPLRVDRVEESRAQPVPTLPYCTSVRRGACGVVLFVFTGEGYGTVRYQSPFVGVPGAGPEFRATESTVLRATDEMDGSGRLGWASEGRFPDGHAGRSTSSSFCCSLDGRGPWPP